MRSKGIRTCNVFEASCDDWTLMWNISPMLVVFFPFPDKLTTFVLNNQLQPELVDGNSAALMQLLNKQQ